MCTIAAETRNYLKEIPHPGCILAWGAINLADPAVVTYSVNCLTELPWIIPQVWVPFLRKASR